MPPPPPLPSQPYVASAASRGFGGKREGVTGEEEGGDVFMSVAVVVIPLGIIAFSTLMVVRVFVGGGKKSPLRALTGDGDGPLKGRKARSSKEKSKKKLRAGARQVATEDVDDDEIIGDDDEEDDELPSPRTAATNPFSNSNKPGLDVDL